METIHESKQKTAGTSGGLSEAALFSVRPNQWTTDIVVSAAMDGLTGRSSSLKTPLGKKTSFRVREWAKRSNSSRTAATPAMTPSETLKSHIKHLGGGRLEKVQVQGTANNTTLLAPPPMRTLRHRASSIESRSTQWLDFYTGSPDPNKPQSQPLPKQPACTDAPRQRPRAGSNSSLRPAPLRVPSSERQNNPSGPSRAAASTPPPAAPNQNPLERKNSKWKPLPNLPKQPAGTRPTNEPVTPPNKQQDSDPAYPAFLPVFRFDSPPPTPDSSTGIAAIAKTYADKEEQTPTPEKTTPPPAARPLMFNRPLQPQPQPKSDPGPAPAPIPEPKREAPIPEPKREAPIPEPKREERARHPTPKAYEAEVLLPPRHTRQERIWLHVNYRGEAPFLQAWGLDIGTVADRVEGMGPKSFWD
ncbi:uncharacterized protein B0H64DRAFT_435544 [Chaetomium fimeti]|uniref:Uncharacterized protein n=1 Tax=Chaetomium fimeti TaxID=1854472 RepID=A0AAE0H879_9PEZI|nr:hypothetical protein B0H64DRAFT_435544 [Chaetomium fimeti]